MLAALTMNQLIFMRQPLLLMRTTDLLLPHCPTTYLIPRPRKPRGFQLDEASIYIPNFPMGPEATSPNWVASHFPALRQVSLWGSCHSHGAAEGHGTLPSGKTPGCLAGGSFAGQLSLTSAWSKEQSQDGTALVTLSLVTASIVFICLFKNSVLPFLTRNLNHILFEILQRDVAMQLPFYKLLNETISSSQLCLKNKGLENKPVFSRPGRQ